jgi:hypothetical protein
MVPRRLYQSPTMIPRLVGEGEEALSHSHVTEVTSENLYKPPIRLIKFGIQYNCDHF